MLEASPCVCVFDKSRDEGKPRFRSEAKIRSAEFLSGSLAVV